MWLPDVWKICARLGLGTGITTYIVKTAVFVDMVTCNVAGVGGRFRGFCYLHHQGTAFFFTDTCLPNHTASHSMRQ